MASATSRDKKYLKYKLIVKSWEKTFKTTHSRLPSKFDIKEAPSNIKYAYKQYFHLKSSALENSLSICDFEEDLGSPDPVEVLACEPLSQPHSEPFLPSLPSGEELEKLLSNVHNIEGKVAKKSKTPSKDITLNLSIDNTKALSPITNKLSQKLFQNSKFSIRNPRKSISFKSQSNLETSMTEGKVIKFNDSKTEIFDSNESEYDISISNITGLDNSQLINVDTSIVNKIECVKNHPVRQFNEAWLERATGVTSTSQISNTNNYEPKPKPSFGLSNISMSVNEEKHGDYVENSESENEDSEINKLKPALKKRKVNDNSSIKLDNNGEEIDNFSETIGNKQSKRAKSKRQTAATSIVKSKGEVEQFPPDLSEFVPFALEQNIVPRHSKPVDILKTVSATTISDEPTISTNKNLNKLEQKISSGTLNENFVRINIEKKVFARGKKNISYSKYKKQLWKDKKSLHGGMEFPESGKVTCFKCGNGGHMARYCTAHRGDTLLPLESYDDSEVPTLEDMQNIIGKSKETKNMSITEQLSQTIYTPSQIPDTFMKMLVDSTSDNVNEANVKPIYPTYPAETPKELHEALEKFGHNLFRSGQEEAILRILSGMSTLLILSTGGGKSLCYQLPAYIYSQHYKCITLVISPLVSLMEDQVLSMPEFLKAGCLHTNQSPTQRKKITQCLKDGEINILLISPEALVSGDGSSGFAGLFKSLPNIAFACIDEAHCVSQWSHNFRPSYLMICKVLQDKLNVKCILGLTATASQSTIKSIITHINVPDGLAGVITNPTLPDNLNLSVSFETDKDRALLAFLTSPRISEFNSVIVYCIRRDECMRVAAVLRSSLQEPGKMSMERPNNKRKRMSYIAEAYHAGMSAAQRKKIQKHFMDGTLRIIVATVAFGMGINKSNIRCIIHYNTPSSFESYVQEVGRAGRDGAPAYCHVFMNNSNNDKNELLKHIHSNTIDRPTVRKLLQKIFIPCQCAGGNEGIESKSNIRCKGHEVGIPIDATIEELDLPSENIATLLCYIELHPRHYIKVLNNAYTICKISSYGGPQKILEAAKNCHALAMAYLIESKKDPEVTKRNIIEFQVIEVAAAIGWESGMTKYHLKNLEWITDCGSSKRSLLKVEFNTLGFRLRSPGDLSSTELDSILDDLHNTVQYQEKAKLCQLEESHTAFKKYGNYSWEKHQCSEEFLLEKSNSLKDTIRDYFLRENNLPSDITLEERPLDVERITSDVRALLCSYKDCTFTGRSVARIFQGISSPNYPALVWGRCKFWRSHIQEDFYGIVRIATQQIIQMKYNK